MSKYGMCMSEAKRRAHVGCVAGGLLCVGLAALLVLSTGCGRQRADGEPPKADTVSRREERRLMPSESDRAAAREAASETAQAATPSPEPADREDRVGVRPFRPEFSPEQQAVLAEASRESAELEREAIRLRRRIDVLRAQAAASDPTLQEPIEALRSAREGQQAFLIAHPDRRAAQDRLDAARTHMGVMQERAEAFLAPAPPASRDGDSAPAAHQHSASCMALGCSHATDPDSLFRREMHDAQVELRSATVGVTEAEWEILASEEGQAWRDRVAEATARVDAAFFRTPEIAELVEAAAEARDRQRTLLEKVQRIHLQGRADGEERDSLTPGRVSVVRN